MKTYSAMHRTFLAFAVLAAIGVGGVSLAHHAENSEVKVNELSARGTSSRSWMGKMRARQWWK